MIARTLPTLRPRKTRSPSCAGALRPVPSAQTASDLSTSAKVTPPDSIPPGQLPPHPSLVAFSTPPSLLFPSHHHGHQTLSAKALTVAP